jgi:hypothetical protein
MDAAAEQLVLDYLRRLEDAAREKLGAAERLAFMARSRAGVARQIGETRAAEADEVERLLQRFGDPDRLVARERQRLDREAPASHNGADTPPGGNGADTARGWNSGDAPPGEDGADTVRGWNSGDAPPGEDGADTVRDWSGGDTALGGAGLGVARGRSSAEAPPGENGAGAARGWNGGDPAQGGDGVGEVPGWDGADGLPGGGGGGAPGHDGAGEVPGGDSSGVAAGSGGAGPATGGTGRAAPAAPPRARPAGQLAAGRSSANAPALRRPVSARWRPGRDLPARPAPGAAPDRTAEPDPGGGEEPGSAAPGWLTGLLAVVRKHPLECLAVVLVGLGGLIDPWPLWLIGALAVLASPLWRVRDKLAAVAIPLAVALVGAIAAAGFAARPPGLSGYVHEVRVDGWNLLRVGAVLGAVYLARQIQRGRRPRREPPWRREPPDAR